LEKFKKGMPYAVRQCFGFMCAQPNNWPLVHQWQGAGVIEYKHVIDSHGIRLVALKLDRKMQKQRFISLLHSLNVTFMGEVQMYGLDYDTNDYNCTILQATNHESMLPTLFRWTRAAAPPSLMSDIETRALHANKKIKDANNTAKCARLELERAKKDTRKEYIEICKDLRSKTAALLEGLLSPEDYDAVMDVQSQYEALFPVE